MSRDQRAELWADVAVPAPLRYALTYAVPEELKGKARPGMRALVQVGPRRMSGVIIAVREAREPRPENLRPLMKLIDTSPLLSEELLSFVLRAAEYYLYPPGEAVRAAMPPGEPSCIPGPINRVMATTSTLAPQSLNLLVASRLTIFE